ncbi:MAG: hypothetical protein ACOCUL_00995, partial [Bacteroidota bacterium]
MVVRKENKKLKVVWICGFTNSLVQKKLKPLKRIGEIAPWITNLIHIFENNPDIELHIISPHTGIPHIKSFEHNEIRYHFLPQGIPLIGLKWPSFFPLDLWTDYFFIKKFVKKLVTKINPDIIHLHGAENTYHTASITQFKDKYPILVTLQGFINNSRSNNKRVIRRKKREKDIYNLFSHFTYRTKTMIRQIEQFRPDANVYFLRYPRKKI